jgi:hypothetical protein
VRDLKVKLRKGHTSPAGNRWFRLLDECPYLGFISQQIRLFYNKKLTLFTIKQTEYYVVPLGVGC